MPERSSALKLSDVENEVNSHDLRIEFLNRRVEELLSSSKETNADVSELNTVCKLLAKSTDSLEKTVANLSNSTHSLETNLVSTNTKMNIMIGILSAIGVALIGVCVKIILGT